MFPNELSSPANFMKKLFDWLKEQMLEFDPSIHKATEAKEGV